MAEANSGDFNPSGCEITGAIVSSHDGSKSEDIKAQVIKFEISQSMDMMSYSGSITVLDNIGLLETFPLRSEEFLVLKLKGGDLGTEVNIKTRVYRIDNIVASESNGGVLFTMNFVSNLSFNSSKRRIIKSYRLSINGIVKEVFNTYYGKLGNTAYLDDKNRTLAYATSRTSVIEEPERSFFIQPTENMTKCVIPNMIPTEAMGFLSSQAYQSETPSNSFKFFETLENFYFATDEYFIKTAQRNDLIELFYSPASSADPTRPLDQINRVEELQIVSKGLDSASDMFSGAYTSKVTEVDLVRRELVHHLFDFSKAKYIDMSGNPHDIRDNPHTPEYRESTFTEENALDFLVYKDYQSGDDIPSELHTDRFASQIISNKLSYQAHLNATVVNASMKGRIDIRPGMIANLEIQNLDGINNLGRNTSLSGRYLIHSTQHSLSDGTLNTGLKLIKFDWSKGEVDG